MLRYRLVSGPAGMSVDPVRGEVVWRPRPEQLGQHQVQVAVRDSEGGSTVQVFHVTVGNGQPPASPDAATATE